MKRILLMIFVLAAVFSVSGPFIPAFSESGSDPFLTFQTAAAGRYFTATADGFDVLEMIPAFGRLFASVGKYFVEGNSLYSYYMAELIPVCKEGQACSGNYSETSIDFEIRLFSNMSMAGNYWPGETHQRLSLFSGMLTITNYSGDGDALISNGNIMLTRNDDLPSIMPYGPEMMGTFDKSALAPSFFGSWKAADGGTEIYVSFDPSGTMLLLRDEKTNLPPQLMKGGFSVSDGELCYLMSSPSSGQMPYQGCARLSINETTLTFSSAAMSDCLLLPDSTSHMDYCKTVY